MTTEKSHCPGFTLLHRTKETFLTKRKPKHTFKNKRLYKTIIEFAVFCAELIWQSNKYKIKCKKHFQQHFLLNLRVQQITQSITNLVLSQLLKGPIIQMFLKCKHNVTLSKPSTNVKYCTKTLNAQKIFSHAPLKLRQSFGTFAQRDAYLYFM